MIFDSNFAFLQNSITASNSFESALIAGNLTGNNSIILSNSDTNPLAKIKGEDSAGADGGDLLLEGGTSTFSAGGDVVVTPGSGITNSGVIRLLGDVVFSGVVSGSISIFSGVDSPEGVVTASIGSLYQRLNGSSGNTIYIKISGVGNTGWAPSGPPIEENFLGNDVDDIFTLSRDFYRNPAIGFELQVFCNGLKLTQGVSTNGFTAVGSNQVQISETPFSGDQISVLYLPL